MSTTISISATGTGASTAASTATTTSSDSPTLTSSASLYLYTFLATLVLLLSVSAAIVVRSYILRRRQRRLIQEAIANGTFNLTPPPGRPRRVGERPTLHDTYLLLDHDYWERPLGDNSKARDWERLTPVAATLVNDQSARSDVKSLPNQPSAQASPFVPAWRRFYPRTPSLSSLSTSARPPPISLSSLQHDAQQSSSSSAEPSTPSLAFTDGQQVNVAFLVAMPGHHLTDEGQLPHVEFGIARVPLAVEPEGD